MEGTHRPLTGAPDDLVRGAERAARDEVRHAAVLGRLARSFGAPVARPRVEVRPCRSLFEVARENAVEGCVRETYGAIEAALQAELAGDRRLARGMRFIARDEAQHAELAWEVAAWARAKLGDDERDAIDDALRSAAFELRREVAREVAPAVAAIAGVPRSTEATRAVDELAARLWGSALAA